MREKYSSWIVSIVLYLFAANLLFADTKCGNGLPSCPNNMYCDGETCQFCNVSEHCGPSCVSCPLNISKCSLGRCVECIQDSECAKGLLCYSGICSRPQICTTTQDCLALSGRICDEKDKICISPPAPCVDDKMCPIDQKCDVLRKQCQTPMRNCVQGQDCSENEYCDVREKQCKPKFANIYEGGAQGCALSGDPSSKIGVGLLWLVFGVGFGFFYFMTKMKRSRS